MSILASLCDTMIHACQYLCKSPSHSEYCMPLSFLEGSCGICRCLCSCRRLRIMSPMQATTPTPNASQGGVSTKCLGQGSADTSYISTWDVFPTELKNSKLPIAPVVKMTYFTNSTQPNTATFVVSSHGIAAYVALETIILGK